jgi:hypothetical protein
VPLQLTSLLLLPITMVLPLPITSVLPLLIARMLPLVYEIAVEYLVSPNPTRSSAAPSPHSAQHFFCRSVALHGCGGGGRDQLQRLECRSSRSPSMLRAARCSAPGEEVRVARRWEKRG